MLAGSSIPSPVLTAYNIHGDALEDALDRGQHQICYSFKHWEDRGFSTEDCWMFSVSWHQKRLETVLDGCTPPVFWSQTLHRPVQGLASHPLLVFNTQLDVFWTGPVVSSGVHFAGLCEHQICVCCRHMSVSSRIGHKGNAYVGVGAGVGGVGGVGPVWVP